MIKERKLILFLFLAFILTVFLLKIDAYATNKLTNEELVVAKHNGIISAMCYVQNLMTGAVAKSIMALSVLGVGWLFLLGGASWVTVLTFTVATSLVFGGLELANIISGNNLSCKAILKAEEVFYETIYNKGLCGINKIPTYATGQIWLACSTDKEVKNDINLCLKKVDNNTYIEEKYDASNWIYKTVVLSKCQEGYLKINDKIYLEYACKKDFNNFGFFDGPKNIKDDIDNGICKLACKESSLNSVYTNNNLTPVIDTNGKVKILSGRLEDGYYPQNTKLEIRCANGFITYLIQQGKETLCEDEICKKNNELILKCGSDGLFMANIICRRSCNFDPYGNRNVSEWGRYDNDKYKPVDTSNVLFNEGNRVIIKSCNEGYMLEQGQSGLIGECRESVWWFDLGGSGCKKICKKSSLGDRLKGNTWLGCNISGRCNENISSKEDFAFGETISASTSCSSGYSIDNSEGEFLKYTCGDEGIWQVSEGRSCKLNCRISDAENNLPGKDYTTKWVDVNGNRVNVNAIIANGQKIKPNECKVSYNVYPNNPTVYVCNDGKFLYYSGPNDEYCKKGCQFLKLKQLAYTDIPDGHDLTDSTKTWVGCYLESNGLSWVEGIKVEGSDELETVYKSLINITEANDYERYARSDSYYKIKECNPTYERVTAAENQPLIAKCNETGEWSLEQNSWNACRIIPKCYEFKNVGESSEKLLVDFDPKKSINLEFQLWGAPGGASQPVNRSLGGYSSGVFPMKPGGEEKRTLYVTVGGAGVSGTTSTGLGGFNGGGNGGQVIVTNDSEQSKSVEAKTPESSENQNQCRMNNGAGGGGATDIRFGGLTLDNRIIVAGGGGGESGWSAQDGFILTGYKGGGPDGGGDSNLKNNGKGGSQTSGGLVKLLDPIYNSFVTEGVKGVGGHGTIYIKEKNCIGGAGGGGGGWYGGSGGAPGAGGGGSGYIGVEITGKTEITTTGPQDGGFARVCWGDWKGQTNPCSVTNHTNNAGITTNRTKCITDNKTDNNIVFVKGAADCTSESLKAFMADRNLSIPEALNGKLPAKYYEGMTIRQECGEGYIADKGDSDYRVEFKCDGNNTWSLSQGECIKRGCQEFKFIGAEEPFEIPDTVKSVKMQVWGGQGAGGECNCKVSKGGYSYGNMAVNPDNKSLFVYVGAKGRGTYWYNDDNRLHWNNGVNTGWWEGGGATDIRFSNILPLTGNDASDPRLIVAGGAGGCGFYNGGAGGGGNEKGGNGERPENTACAGAGGTSNSGGGIIGNVSSGVGSGSAGVGGIGVAGTGGSGWFGGGGGCKGSCHGAGGGGSGHLSDQIINGTGGGQSGVREGDGFARICWGYHPACDDTVGKRNEECTMEEYSCNDSEVSSDYNVTVITTDTTVAGTSKVFPCKSGYTGSVKLWCGRDKWVHISGECKIAHGCYEFTPTGKGKKLDMSNVNFGNDSRIQIQLWGAPGGNTSGKVNNENIGGYSKGTLELSTDKVLYIFVGGKGGDGSGVSTTNGKGGASGFNGGGRGGGRNPNTPYFGSGGGGGGATDIRFGGLTLDNRIIVAGGGGGNVFTASNIKKGGKGGGNSGGDSVPCSTYNSITACSLGQGGKNNTGAPVDLSGVDVSKFLTAGIKGIGGFGDCYFTDNAYHSGAGGGGGYYGGSGSCNVAGGGGSGYIGGVTDGQTTTVSTGPTNGGFARICWGDWTGQTSPCSVTNHTNNAGITTNRTKCIVNPSTEDVVGGTLPTCSLDKLLTTMDTSNVNRPANAAANLPANYYEGMAVRNECKSGYSLVSGGVSGRVEFTCGSDGNWKVNGNCGVSAVCYEFTPTGKGKKLNMSNVNFGNDSRIQIQLWGAPGGGTRSGLGGYSKGTLKLSTDKVLYIFVGGRGSDDNVYGGFNGGGQGGVGTSRRGFGGGGATDIRFGGLTLNNRIIVAGGGGGSGANDQPANGNGGAGGNLNGSGASLYPGTGGSQTAGGTISKDYGSSVFATIGVLGQGGYGSGFLLPGAGAGAGGGYYGGGGGDASRGNNSYAAGGGSGYIGGVTDGQTTTVSTGPTNGGFARICWGDWTDQTSPCSVTNHTNNAGITTNRTKCIVNPSTENVVGGTLPACSLDKLLTTMDTSNVNKPTTTASNLPANYYQGMAIRSYCKSGYSLVSGGVSGLVEFTCGSDGNWKVNGSCIQYCTITANPGGSGWWTTDESNRLVVNDKVPYGTTLKQVCPSGYSYGSNRRTATCNGEGKAWTDVNINNSCVVPGGCQGRPGLVAGSKFLNSVADGNFYLNGSITSNYSASGVIASDGTLFDANCESGYTEIGSGGNCDNCGGRQNTWAHYYYCQNGTWKTAGSCKKNCTMPANPANGSWSGSTGHGSTITQTCNSGYTISGSKTARCDNGNWSYSGNAVCVYGFCRGRPTSTTGGYSGSSIIGTIYLNGGIASTSDLNNTNIMAEDGTKWDGHCNSGYTEVSTDGDCTASQCGGQNSWGHYYYCQNGTWKRVGSCKRNCSNINVYRRFEVNNKDNCRCDQSISCTINTQVSSLAHGATTSRSCDTGDTSKKCSPFCTTYHRRVSGYCDVSCNNGVAKINCVQTRACSQGDNNVCY